MVPKNILVNTVNSKNIFVTNLKFHGSHFLLCSDVNAEKLPT